MTSPEGAKGTGPDRDDTAANPEAAAGQPVARGGAAGPGAAGAGRGGKGAGGGPGAQAKPGPKGGPGDRAGGAPDDPEKDDGTASTGVPETGRGAAAGGGGGGGKGNQGGAGKGNAGGPNAGGAGKGNPGARGGGGGGGGARPAQVPVPVEPQHLPARMREDNLPVRARPGGRNRAGAAQVSMATVPPARLRHRHRYLFVTFVLMVLLPAMAAFWYLYTRAEDRYASDAAFFVHREDTTSSIDTMFGLSALGGSSTTPDGDVLYQFIRSQRMVEIADQALDLRAMFSQHYDTDPVYSLDPEASLEDMIDYWERVVSLVFDADSGLINLEVVAFTPEDAQRLAQLVLDESASLVDRLSQIAQEDGITQARNDLTLAEERVKATRIAVAEFRTANQAVDPQATVAGSEGVITALEQRLAEELINRDALVGTTTRADDPRLERADRMIEAIRLRIADERSNVGTDEARAVGAYEELLVERQFAEQAYTAALGALDAAVAEARRKSRYLAVHIEPTLAASSVYPRRVLVGLAATGFLFLAWGTVMLVLMSIRDRR